MSEFLAGRHVSVDIEACGEVLMSIGACVFSPVTGRTVDVFYGVFSAKEQTDRGLKLDPESFMWWLTQSDEARKAVADPQAVAPLLESFSAFMGKEAWVWAYPTSFDLPVIERVYKTWGMRSPWKWTKTLDGRTLWRLACALDPSMERIEKEANPSPHHALADATEQARWFAKYLRPVLQAPGEALEHVATEGRGANSLPLSRQKGS